MRTLVRTRRSGGVVLPGAVSGGTTQPNLAALPELSTTHDPNTSAYSAFNVPSQAAGYSYADPTTGVTVYKVSDASTPVSNIRVIPDYFEGSIRISQPWGGGSKYTILAHVWPNTNAQYWLVDFDYVAGTFSSWRQASAFDAAEITCGFSASASTPQVAYITNGGWLRKYDCSGTGAPVEITGGVWPKDLTAHLNGASRYLWLSFGTDERWFVVMPQNSTRLVAWNAQTDSVLVRPSTDFTGGLDEPKMERNGVSVWVRHGGAGASWWNLDTNTLAGFATDVTANSYRGHGAVLKGRAAGTDSDYNGDVWTQAAGAGSITRGGTNFGFVDVMNGGQWINQAATDATQYMVTSSNTTTTAKMNKTVAFIRADGTDARLLCHHYGAGGDHTGNQYYDGFIWAQPSPDGKLVMFKSSMLSTTGRADLFLAKVPVA